MPLRVILPFQVNLDGSSLEILYGLHRKRLMRRIVFAETLEDLQTPRTDMYVHMKGTV